MSIVLDKVLGTPDPRTIEGYFMADHHNLMYVILGGYFYIVKSLGPKLMKDRKPFSLKTVLMVYNILQIITNFLLFYRCLSVQIRGRVHPFCASVQHPDESIELEQMEMVNYYLYLKLLDLAETIFFIMRKKDNQVTVLHVYHHIMMVFCAGTGLRYCTGGVGLYLPIYNTFIHAIMYMYYLMTSQYPQYAKNLWWKKYLTQLQIVHHFMIFTTFLGPLLFDCGYNKNVAWMLLPNNAIVIILFCNFYYQSYIKKKRTA